MSGEYAAPGEYVRVYLSIREDPRFAEVYGDNDRLATWLRLLMEADAVWPAAAPVPRAVDDAALAALVEAGIIELLPLDHYRVHGLDAERQRRSELGRIGGIASGVARNRTAVERPLNEGRTETNTQRRATQRNATPRSPLNDTTKRNGADRLSDDERDKLTRDAWRKYGLPVDGTASGPIILPPAEPTP